MSQIGITVQVNAQDQSSFWTIGQESAGDRWKDLQLYIQEYAGQPDPFYSTGSFVKAQVGIWNWERFKSDRYDDLDAKAVTIEDPSEREKLYYEMQDLMEESGAYRFPTDGGRPVVYRTTKVQAATRPDGITLFLGFKPT